MQGHSLSTLPLAFSIQSCNLSGSFNTYGHKGHCTRPAEVISSRKGHPLPEELGDRNKGPMGHKYNSGGGDRIFPTPFPGTKTNACTLGTGYNPDLGRANILAPKRSHKGTTPKRSSERLLLKHIPSPQKRWEHEACHKPEGLEPVRGDPTLQDGGNEYPQRSPPAKRLAHQSGLKGRLLCNPNPQGTPSLLEILGRATALPVHLPSLRAGQCPLDFYEDPQVSYHPPQRAGYETDTVYRRYTDYGRLSTEGERTYTCPSASALESGFHNSSRKVSDATNPKVGIPGVASGHYPDAVTSARGEDKEDTAGSEDPAEISTVNNYSKESIQDSGENERHVSGYSPSSTFLPLPSGGPAQGPGQSPGGVRCCLPAIRASQGGTPLVDDPPGTLEWQEPHNTFPTLNDRIRCLPQRLGSSILGDADRGPLESRGETISHQLPGDLGSNPGCKNLCQTQDRYLNLDPNRQHNSCVIHKPPRGNCLSQGNQLGEGSLALVPPQEHLSEGSTPPRNTEHCGGQRVKSNERQVGLDVESSGIPEHSETIGTNRCRPVCISPNSAITPVLQLETRPTGIGSRRLSPELGGLTSLCQPTMELDRQSPVESTEGTSGNTNSDNSHLAISGMVPNTPRFANRLSQNLASGGNNSGDNRVSTARNSSQTSRMAYLKQRFESENLSEPASKLLLASWRTKSAQSYDSLFQKWVSWCAKRETDPIHGPVSEVANFLADLFEQGYQQRSINAYRSAIASVHDRVDGASIGQHPTISRLMAGIANCRPPQPRYHSTWDVNTVLCYFEKLGRNDELSLSDLTGKTAMLLALTRPSRSADLHSLDIEYGRPSPEGFTFLPSKLPKQSRMGKPTREFFFPRFPDNSLLCPVEALTQYLTKTEPLRVRDDGASRVTQLFIACIKPHNPIVSSTIARWLKKVLEKAGINTSIFKAHSTRGASVSAAAMRGVSTNDILHAADWSTETVFQKFYYKPIHDASYGRAILSKK